MASATTTILSTPELLTEIHTLLPLLTLLHARRVSRCFSNKIVASPRLQQQLYSRPTGVCLAKKHKKHAVPEQNPLLRDLFSQWFNDISVHAIELPL
jgi:hypothetical protein